MLSLRQPRMNFANRSPIPFPGRVGMTIRMVKSGTSVPGKPALLATIRSSLNGPINLAPASSNAGRVVGHSDVEKMGAMKDCGGCLRKLVGQIVRLQICALWKACSDFRLLPALQEPPELRARRHASRPTCLARRPSPSGTTRSTSSGGSRNVAAGAATAGTSLHAVRA